MDASKKDLYFVIIVAAVIILAIVTFWLGGKGNEIVSYLSFASAIVSIVLALVAIFYSIVQNVNSQQNIGEMRILVSEASRLMSEKASVLEDAVERLIQGDVALKETATTTTPAGAIDVSVFFSLMVTSELVRLFAYFLSKSHDLKKSLPVNDFVHIVKPLVKMPINELSSHMYGILFGLSCCLKVEMSEGQTKVKLLSLPENFQNHLDHHIGLMTKRNPGLSSYIVQIDKVK